MSENVKQIADKNKIKRFIKIYKEMKKDPEIKEERLKNCEKGIRNLINDYNEKYKVRNWDQVRFLKNTKK